MNNKETFKRIWALCAPFHRSILCILSILLVTKIVQTVFPIILGETVSAVLSKNVKMMIVCVLSSVGLTLIKDGLQLTRELFELEKIDFSLSRHLNKISLEKYFSISMGQHHLGHSLIKQSIMRKGETAISGILFMAIYEVIPIVLMIVLPLTMLAFKAPKVALCAMAVMAIYVWSNVRYHRGLGKSLKKIDTLQNKAGRKFGEAVSNSDVVFINAQEKRMCTECDAENEIANAAGRPFWNKYVKCFYGTQSIIVLGQGLCIGFAGYLAYKGEYEAGTFVTLTMWIGNSLGTLTNVSFIQRSLARNIGPIHKYFRFLDFAPDVTIPQNPVRLSHIKGDIEFRDVSFSYVCRKAHDELNKAEDETDEEETNPKTQKIAAVKNVTFRLEAGKRHAFVGTSGAGKSTIVNLILRAFDPQNGHILIDGVDLRSVDFRELRRNIGFVPQDISLFDGSVKYNITFGLNGKAHEVTEQELDRVAEISRLSEFKSTLEMGYDTLIGERGIKLSGGQRQRLGIARAMIKNPSILIFDEATSSLDTENEAQIRESIDEVSAGKTTIIIAHRLATVVNADKIFVFEKGELIAAGTHKELIANCEHYRTLVKNQVISAK